MESEEIKNKTIRSIVALTSRQMINQVITMLTLIPLGLFLSQQAFGTYVAVSAIYPFFNFFVDLGLGAALVQKHENLEENDLRTVFTLQEILVFLVIAVGWLLTPFIASFARLGTDGINLYYVFLLVLFISSLKSIPSILLERKIAFETQIIPSLVEQFVFSVIVVILAYNKFQVAAYSWAYLISALAGLPLYYLLSPWKVSFGLSWGRARRLLSFGIMYQAKNGLALIKDNLLVVFLSGLPAVGTVGLGYVGWWQRWAYSPFNFIVSSVTKVTFPTYARVQDQAGKLQSGIERSLYGVSLIMFPVLTLMAVLIDKLLFLLPKYQKWAPGLPLFYFFLAGAAVSSLSGILVNALDATGNVRKTLGLMVLWILLIWPLTIFFVSLYGYNGVAVAPLVVSLTIFLTIYLVKRVVTFNFLGNVLKPALASLIMAAVLWGLWRFLPVTYLTFILAGLTGAIIYLSAIWLLDGRKIRENFNLIYQAYRK